MTDPKVLLRDLFAAGDTGDLDAFDRLLHPDIVVHAPAGLSTSGIENEKQSWRRAKATMPDLRHEFVELVGENSVVAARCVVTGTLQGSYGDLTSEGRPFRVDQSLFAHVLDGKIVELWEIVDTATLEAQLKAPDADGRTDSQGS